MKKSKRNILIGIIAVIILVGILFYFSYKGDILFSGSGAIHSSYATLISDTPQSTTYKITFIAYGISQSSGGRCGDSNSLNLNFNVNSEQKADIDNKDANLPENTPTGTFETKNVVLGGVNAGSRLCTDIPESRDVEIANPLAVCEILRTSDNLINYNCKVTAILYAIKNGVRDSGNFFGGTGGVITLEIPKSNNTQVITQIPVITETNTDNKTGLTSEVIYTQENQDNISNNQVLQEKINYTNYLFYLIPLVILLLIGYIIYKSIKRRKY